MTPDQGRQLGELLWADGDTKLPDVDNFAIFGFLHLPFPPAIDVVSVVKRYILSLPSTGAVSRNAQGSQVIAMTGREQELIFQASLASQAVVQLAGEQIGKVEWSSDEARQLYQKARDWWTNDKPALFKSETSGFMGSGSIRTTASRLGQFLTRIVLPRMEWADENDWQQLLGWLQEMRDLDVYPTVAMPYVLMLRPAEVEAVARTTAVDINSDVEDAVAAAAKAIRHWVHLSSNGRTLAPPEGLMTALVERVVFRSQPGITGSLTQLAFLIFEKPEAITIAQASLLTASLGAWHHATMLPVPDVSGGDFPEAERPILRVCIGRLAGALKIWYEKASPGTALPPGVNLWRDLCGSDSLPEIRRAFTIWEHIQ
jgi:hypothetical protein